MGRTESLFVVALGVVLSLAILLLGRGQGQPGQAVVGLEPTSPSASSGPPASSLPAGSSPEGTVAARTRPATDTAPTPAPATPLPAETPGTGVPSGSATSASGGASGGTEPAPTPGQGERAQTTVPPPAATSPTLTPDGRALERGQQLARLLYTGRLGELWAAFTPAVRADWGSLSAFQAYRRSGLEAYGAETRVLREQVTRNGTLTYYSRTATFERGPRQGWTLIFGLDDRNRVQEFGIVEAALLSGP